MSVLLKHLRIERGPAIVLFVVVLVASFLMAAIPRFYNQVLDSELQSRLENAPAARRNIVVTVDYRLEVYQADELHQQLETSTTSYRTSLAPELQEIIQSQHYVISLPELTILKNETPPEPQFVRKLRMTHSPDIDQHIEYLAGGPPADRRFVEATGMSAWFPGRDTVNLAVIEIALSQASADRLSLGVGDIAVIQYDETGTISAVYVSGIFQVLDPEAAYWNNDRSLVGPVHVGSGDVVSGQGEQTVATGIVSLDGHGRMLSLTPTTDRSVASPFQYRWIYAVDPAKVNISNYPAIVAETRQLQATLGAYSTFANTLRDNVRVTNDLAGILSRFRADSQYALAVVVVTTIAVLATMLASIAVLASLIANRTTGRSALIRGRGASSRQMTLGMLVETLIVCLPAALLGWLAATVVVDGRSGSWPPLLVLATLLLTTLLLLITSRRNLLTDLGELLGRRQAVPAMTDQRRLVLELFVVVVAIGGIVVLRRRGLAPSAGAELDPMLAAVPVLLMLVVGILVLRLHPLLMSAAARLLSRRRDIVPFVALRSAAARPASAHLPLLVMVLAVGVACFAIVTFRTVDSLMWGSVWELGEDGQYIEILNPAFDTAPPSPLAEGLRRSLLLGSFIAMAHAILAILTALILGAAARRREVSYLRTIGLSSRQTAALTAIEYLPMIVLACPAGLIFGIVTAKLVESTINLGTATGTDQVATIAIPWLEVGLIPAALAVTVTIVVGAFTLIARRTQLTALTRMGDG